MTGSSAGLIAFAISVLSCSIVLFFAEKRFGTDLDRNKSNLRALKRRLHVYSVLSGERTIVGVKKFSRCELSSSEHRVLLGILKKIETKNGILAAVSALVFTVSVSTIPAIVSELSSEAGVSNTASENFLFPHQNEIFLGVVLGIGFMIMAALIVGLGHISNSRHMKLHKIHACDDCLAVAMQKDLMKDLLLKESRFALAKWGLVIVLFLWASLSATILL